MYDFAGASSLFNDPDWDGEPLDPVQPKGGGNGVGNPGSSNGGGTSTIRKSTEIIIKIESTVKNISAELNTSFYMADGRLISTKEFIELLYGEIPKVF